MKFWKLAILCFSMLIFSSTALVAKKVLKKTKTKKSDYVYEYTYNVRVQNAPLLIYSLFAETYTFGIEGLYFINRNFSVGPVVNYFASGDGEDSDDDRTRLGSVNFGLRGDFYFGESGYTDGSFYISNALLYGFYNYESHSLDFDTPGCKRNYKSEGVALVGSFMFGYQWMFESGININTGIGGILTRNIHRGTEEFNSECGGIERFKEEVSYEPYSGAWFDLSIGYAF